MRASTTGTLLSATDLNAYLGCRHATFLDIAALSAGVSAVDDDADPQLELLRDKGFEHERRYFERLRAEGKDIADIHTGGTLDERVAQTREAMARGAEVIYQGALLDSPWHGYSDFLVRVDGEGLQVQHSYEVLDTKLARSAHPKHVIQLCVYSKMLGRVQERTPESVHLVLGDGTKATYPLSHFVHYMEMAQRRLEAFAASPPSQSTAEPCDHCVVCRWLPRCEEEWERVDHLSRVAGIARTQIAKLRAAGIDSMRALARLPAGTSVPKLQPESLARLKQQARLQAHKLETGENALETLPSIPGKGFARIPMPDRGDLFFDMEGDPLFEGGLEYLFGFAFREGEEVRFQPFWGHSRAEEKRAFEQAMDFIVARLARYPEAHVYHYANYEQAAFNALSILHGTREAALDDLLRQHKFVDLYRVVRESIRVSEPSYSIKNLEHFYMPEREGAVASGGESIVVYEQWRELGDAKLLEEIERYNETDCRSTLGLRDWLLTLRPEAVGWYEPGEVETPERAEVRSEREKRRDAMTAALMAGLGDAASQTPLQTGSRPPAPARKGRGSAPWDERDFRELVSQLLEFHRREAKPTWWAMFAREVMSEEELIDDAECIGGLRRIGAGVPDKQSTIHPFRFPAQDFKMRVGDPVKRADTLENAGEVHALDDVGLTVELRIGNKQPPLPDALSIIPQGPLRDGVLREAIYRYAESVAKGTETYAAITRLLRKQLPVIAGVQTGGPIIDGALTTEKAVEAIRRLSDCTLVVQGPPGSGKTYTASHAIVALLREGKRVGVSSNSHKAIVTLLKAVEKVAKESGFTFRGANKCSRDDHRLKGTIVEDLFDNELVEQGNYQLIAGTAWLFARPGLDQALDTLFIDEAGQVSLANLVATGVSARKIVLVGDQMQLAQPRKGAHPGESGLSALQFALGEHETVPLELGIFLDRSWRMHPDVCGYISEAFYEGRLLPEAGNERQRLVLATNCDAALKPAGISFVEVAHSDCSQKCEAEAERLVAAYRSLLEQRWIDRDGEEHAIDEDEILVVSPYNMQVDLLRKTLPSGARVGTVDKFQGQEGAAVLVSMASSSAEDSPRGLDFLFSRNRLNVAVSRAKCFAAVFASPKLLEASCKTVEQLRMVDALCWAKLYAEG